MSARHALSLHISSTLVLLLATLLDQAHARTEEYWTYHYGREKYETLEEAEAAMRAEYPKRGEFLIHTSSDVSRDGRRVRYTYSIEPQPIEDISPRAHFILLKGGHFDCGNGQDGCSSIAEATQVTYDYIVNLPRCNVEYDPPGKFELWWIQWIPRNPVRQEAVDLWYDAPMPWYWASYFHHNPDLHCGTQHSHGGVARTIKRGYCPPGLPPRHELKYFPDRTCWNNLRDSITARLRQVCHDTEGNPCSPATGTKTLSETDFQAPRLSFHRYYNSAGQFPNKTGLGPGWSHNYSTRVLTRRWYPDHPVHLVNGRGQYERFEPVGDRTWRSVNKQNLTIRKIDSGWELRSPAGQLKIFDNAGRLVRIESLDPPVSKLILFYTEEGRLSEVQADTGRALEFVYYHDQLKSVVLPGGGQLTYAHDENGNLTSVQYPDGEDRTYLYENGAYPHALTGIIDELGNRFATYSYDHRGRVISSEHAGGADRVELQYRSDGTTLVRRATGSRVRYSFGNDPFTSTESLSYANGTEYRQHDSKGRILSRTDKDGTTTGFQYDDMLLTAITEGQGSAAERTTHFKWNTTVGRKRSERLAGRETIFEYDSDGRLLRRTLRAAADLGVPVRETTWDYQLVAPDVVRRVATNGARRDVADVTRYEFYDHDAGDGSYHAGDLHRRVDAQGQVTEYLSYDPLGRPTAILDPNGNLTTFTYNARGWLTSRTIESASGTRRAITRLTYDPTGNLARVTNPDGSAMSYEYDDAHRLVALEDWSGNRVEYTLDAAGNRARTRVEGPGGSLFRKTAREFDELNRLISEINGVGNATQHAYASDGKQISTTEPDGDQTRFSHDALDRLTSRLDALGGETRYDYDDYGNLIQVVDPRGVTTKYDYDPLGNLLAEHSPDAGTTTYQYDAAGNRITETDARGVTAEFTYDSLDRPTRIEYSESGQNLQFSYDEGSNGAGRLTSFSDPTGTTEYDYNYLGKITADRRRVNDINLTAEYRYNDAGNTTEMTYPSGNRIRFERDTNGRISAVRLVSGGTTKPIAGDIQYAPFGPVAQIEWGDGSIMTRQFDTAGRLIEQQTDGFQHLTWEFARDGNITRLANLVEPEQNQIFAYDSLNRLAHAEGTYGVLDYEYDSVGNRRQLIEDGTVTNYTYALESNRLLATGGDNYQYDAAGNTTQTGDLSLTYNARGRLAGAEPAKGKGATYGYNALGQRVIKTAKNKSHYFMYGLEGHLIGEYDDRGEVIREYVYLKGRPIAMLRPKGNKTEVLYIHADHLGTPKLMTNSKGQLRWESASRPFGGTTVKGKGVEFPLRFPGQYADEESGLHQNYFRDYEAATGRYLEADPIGIGISNNLYAYARGNPIHNTDASGLVICREFTDFEKTYWRRRHGVDPSEVCMPPPEVEPRQCNGNECDTCMANCWDQHSFGWPWSFAASGISVTNLAAQQASAGLGASAVSGSCAAIGAFVAGYEVGTGIRCVLVCTRDPTRY